MIKMKTILMVVFVVFLTGCENKPITMQDVEKAKLESEQKNREITAKLQFKFDSEYNHLEFCNKYGALYYVDYDEYGYHISAPVLDKDSKVIPCMR